MKKQDGCQGSLENTHFKIKSMYTERAQSNDTASQLRHMTSCVSQGCKQLVPVANALMCLEVENPLRKKKKKTAITN
jgi:hypothetical protein